MLRWENCVKRDVRKAREEEDCKKKTRYRGGLKRLSDEAVKKLWTAKGKQRKREREQRFVWFKFDNLCRRG